MAQLPPGYDAWRTAGPDEDHIEVGTEWRQPCNRIHEPDEDAPRGYKPKPCPGTMDNNEGYIECDRCGERPE